MNVGVSRITIRLPENQTLKGKRRVLTSICSRVHNKFNVSIAEVDCNPSWQLAILGISFVSNSTRHTNEVLQHVASFIEGTRDELEIINQEQENFSGF